ncbi:hypothetical protein GCM10028774_56430 [Spirosoma jeollabukense]
MMSFDIGRPFPIDRYQATGQESIKAMMTVGLFDILFYTLNPVDDRALFNRGLLRYGLYEREGLPSFLIEFPGHFSFELPLNIRKIDPDAVADWIKSDANGLTLYLLNARSNIIEGIRFMGLRPELITQLRQVSQEQLARYPTPSAVEDGFDQIYAHTSLDQMVRGTTMYLY